jgi:nucleoside-diphosphate-sugar epimerase
MAQGANVREQRPAPGIIVCWLGRSGVQQGARKGKTLARFLVTGVAGFIGRSIAAALLARGESVRGIDSFITGKKENLIGLKGLEFVERDLADPAACAQACEGIEVVFHEAALASVPRSVADPVATNVNCVDATLNVLVAAKAAGVRRVVYAGSSSAYGDTPTLPKREDMLPNPISPYAVAKLAGEHYMSTFTRVYGLETVTLRYFNVFGPYQDPTSHYSGVLAIFCRRMLAGEQPTIYGDGEQSRDFTYIDNVVHANLLAAEASAEKVSGRMMNMATATRVTLNETFGMLKELTGYEGSPAYAPPRAGDIRDSLADIGLARALLGYEPIVDFREGLRRTVGWYRGIQV